MNKPVHITLDIDMPLEHLERFLRLIKDFDTSGGDNILAQVIFKAPGQMSRVQEIWNRANGGPTPIKVLVDADLVQMIKDSSRGNVDASGRA